MLQSFLPLLALDTAPPAKSSSSQVGPLNRFSAKQKQKRFILLLYFFMSVLLVEYIFLTTFYGLYFNHQLHYTISSSSYMFYGDLVWVAFHEILRCLQQVYQPCTIMCAQLRTNKPSSTSNKSLDYSINDP